MVLPELQAMAGQLGITGASKMRKGDIIAAIQERQTASPAPAAAAPAAAPATTPRRRASAASAAPASEEPVPAPTASPEASPSGDERPVRDRQRGRARADRPERVDAESVTRSDAHVDADNDADTRTDGRGEQAHDGNRDRGQGDGFRDRGARLDNDGNRNDSNRNDGNRDRGARTESDGSRTESNRNDGNRDRGPRNDNDGNRERGPRNDNANRNDGSRNDGNRDRGPRNDNARNDNARNDNASRNDNARNDNAQGNRNDSPRNENGRDRGPRQDGADLGPTRDDEFGGGPRRGRRREREFGARNQRDRGPRGQRDRFAPGSGNEAEPIINDDDILVPVAGILDVLDSYAFVRTSGYLPGPNDVYVSLAQVRRYNLRKGDAVTGAVKQPRDGERKDKFNALVRLDTVNGINGDDNTNRVDFGKLTPLYPQDRLRLESEGNLTTRMIDLIAPIGKGQRGLIVSPPKAGKTMVLQAIANAITRNNPECHLMVVLVDERPEEVTDMTRSVKGEVIASTFDRPAEDHTIVAELAIERAKRLVELGHDVVILLDSITRLGRAYNLAAPASGRILSGGVDSTALYPPKRFFGAARNIEDGGSLTILATALVETGSKMDEVIFEEFKGTGNMELKLDRRFADKRIFPAVDIDASGTRKEEILMAPDELQLVWRLRRVLHALDSFQAIELMLGKLKETKSNAEFLMQIQKTTFGGGE
jgi:transcription termination factor Rho